MMRMTVLVAGIFSLILMGTADEARADAADGPAGVYRLFGKSMCLAHAPPEASCDIRFPAPGGTSSPPRAAESQSSSFTLFGSRFCIGAAEGTCDVRIPDRPQPRVRSFNIFGVSFCFGDMKQTSHCTVRIPETVPSGSRRTASL